MRVTYEELIKKFQRILESRGFEPGHARTAAEIFAGNSLDGVYSHGTNRFPKMIRYLDEGGIDPKAIAECETASGPMERWNGHLGLGPLNARIAMNRACELAREYGVGIVAIGNNNHWMRGGSYGIQAAEQGMIGICWSNTMPNMPAWGGKNRKIGNNPLIFAIPRSNGEHVVLDCAVSQFSYGKIEETRMKGEQLPVPGGYDMGYWKGSGLSIVLDLIATILTNGNSVAKVGTFGNEIGLSQVMIAIDPRRFNTVEQTDAIADEILADIHSSEPVKEGQKVYYPGERSMETRRENLKNGIPVLDEVWEKLESLEPKQA